MAKAQKYRPIPSESINERTYLKFDTSAIAGKSITDAKLLLQHLSGEGCGVSQSGIKARQITSSWSANSITWQGQPTTTTAGEATARDPGGCVGSPPENVQWTWGITAIAQSWAAGSANHGIMLAAVDESVSAPEYDRGFSASENIGPGFLPPVLQVTYQETPPGGVATPTSLTTSGEQIADRSVTQAAASSWTPDRISLTDCRNDNKGWLWKRNELNRPEGWFKNRFSWCYWDYRYVYRHYDDRNGKRHYLEIARFRMTLIGEATSTDRTFIVKARYDDFERIHLKMGQLPQITGSDVFSISAESTGSNWLGQPVNNAPIVGSTCQVNDPSKKGFQATWSFWEQADQGNGHEVVFEFTSPKSSTSDIQFIHQCKLGFTVHWANLYSTDSPQPRVRCDSAPYVTHFSFQEGGCVFRGVMPSMEVKRGVGYDAQVDHLQFIERYPQLTIPEWPGFEKEIRGFSKNLPLRRAGYANVNQLNRRAARAECAKKWGPNYSREYGEPDAWGIVDQEGIQGDCDEFPFNATYNGVAYQKQEALRNYSVAVINGPQNEYFGTQMNLWFSKERVIDQDQFFLRLV